MVVAAGLLALVLVVYGRTIGFGFVNFDDHIYVSGNPYVRQGLSRDGVLWAFGSFHGSNWHPLTWLSHMADVELLGLSAGRHHVVSVLLHTLNTVLLFGWLRQATDSVWRAAVVAALFGVHPLHVESVAWISERKDVLSTLFWLLAMIAYVAWVRQRSVARYTAVIALVALGLLSKPMVVTLPFALLLVDAWPLGRLGGIGPGEPFQPCRLAGLIAEKVPLFLLVAASAIVTWLAQKDAAAVRLADISLRARVTNALVAYCTYVDQMLWPVGLAVFYPHPAVLGRGHGAFRVVLAAIVLVAITVVVVRFARTRPYLAWGWLWYVGTLVPVIGVVQVGMQTHADRYTYVPLIGVLVAVVWLLASFAPASRRARAVGMAGATAAVIAYAAVAFVQVGYWRNSETLWRRALAVTSDNWQAWKGLGDALLDADRPLEALDAHEQALRIVPRDGAAWNGVAMAHGRVAGPAVALPHFQNAVRIDPKNVDAWFNLGITHGMMGDHQAAATAFERCVALRADHVGAWENLVVARRAQGDTAAAGEALLRLERLDPARAAALRRW